MQYTVANRYMPWTKRQLRYVVVYNLKKIGDQFVILDRIGECIGYSPALDNAKALVLIKDYESNILPRYVFLDEEIPENEKVT